MGAEAQQEAPHANAKNIRETMRKPQVFKERLSGPWPKCKENRGKRLGFTMQPS